MEKRFIARNGTESIINFPNNAVEVDMDVSLKLKFMVRMIRTEGSIKKVMGEEEFSDRPTEGQLIYCLSKYPDATFAVVEEIYTITDDRLPFM